MNITDLTAAATYLPKGTIQRLHDASGQRIEALDGSLWVTVDNDRRDIVVNSGEGFTIDRDGDTLISALDDARFVLLAPVAAPLRR